MSNFKIISSYHSTINLYTTSMGAESFVKPKKYIAGISDLAALVRHLIWKGILIYRRNIGAGCTRSAVEFLKVFHHYYTHFTNVLYTGGHYILNKLYIIHWWTIYTIHTIQISNTLVDTDQNGYKIYILWWLNWTLYISTVYGYNEEHKIQIAAQCKVGVWVGDLVQPTLQYTYKW